MKIRKYGLIGYPLSHSFSPKYFAEKFEEEGIRDARYDAYPLEDINDILQLEEEHLSGLNVTIPYKEAVIPYLDEISPEAAAIGAVNTIKYTDGRRIGYNTDVFGFSTSLQLFLGTTVVEKALVLGTGGAAKAVSYALDQLGIDWQYVSRYAPHLTYDALTGEDVATAQLIINTTPLGMYPLVDVAPDIPYTYLTSNHSLYDLVYNPSKTLFLLKGEAQNCSIKSGYDMLILQAEKSWEIWNLT